MKAMLLVLCSVGAVAAGGAQAQSGADLLKAKNCLGCHDMQAKKVGPAFKDVAAKHKDDKQAGAALAAKLKDGKGHPKVAASDAELKSMLDLVLAAK